MRLRKMGGLLRRGRRRAAAFVYGAGYPLDLPGMAYDAQRGERILAFLGSRGLVARGDVRAPEPATFRQIRRVHEDEYLESLYRPGALTSIVGLELSDPIQERFLEVQRAMAGGTILAAGLAIEGGGVAVNLGGGFHHASAGRGDRFCAFNDVAIAIAELRARGFLEPVLVVDLDLHDGDGTRALFAADPTVYTFSIHNRTTGPPAAVAHTCLELGGEVEDGPYLEAIRAHLPPVVESFRPGLAFYLAGCDPAAGDEIGDWRITAEGMLERDRFVLSLLRGGDRAYPLAILLAGGYGKDAWRYGARSLSWLLAGEAAEPPSTEEVTVLRYRELARTLEPHQLTGDGTVGADDWGLSAEDFGPGHGMGLAPPSRFLGFYSRQGLELALERAGLLDRLRARGFERPTLALDLGNPAGDTARLYGGPGREELLIELRVRIDRRTVAGLALLRIEWLLLQDPRAPFTPERPPLPGQSHPGLGILGDVMALLVLACDRLGLDGIVFIPSHFHLAAKGRKLLRFLDPEDEGLIQGLEKALAGLPLAEATRAVANGEVLEVQDEAAGRPFAWRPMPMVIPVGERLRERLDGEDHARRVAEAEARSRFRWSGRG